MKKPNKPPFIRSLPDEVEIHGANAALVLAHIRYRCQSDGPERFEVDGVRWWRVSHTDLGFECGLSRQSVRTALKALDGLVVANTFPRWDADSRTIDQTRAYRVVSCEGLESTEPDMRVVNGNHDPAGIDHDLVDSNHGPGWHQPGTGLESTNVPSLETLETKAGDPPDPLSDEPPARDRLPSRRTGSQIALAKFSATPVAENSAFARRIARAYSDSLPVPIEAGVLTKIGVEADKCLRSQIPPDAIAAGIREWADSDSWSPSQIPTFVAKAAARAARTANGIGKPTENALGYQAAGEALIARLESA